MTAEDREAFQANRDVGLRARHEQRLARAACPAEKPLHRGFQLVCGLRKDHEGKHWDPISSTRWDTAEGEPMNTNEQLDVIAAILRDHQQARGIRDLNVHCLCGWTARRDDDGALIRHQAGLVEAALHSAGEVGS